MEKRVSNVCVCVCVSIHIYMWEKSVQRKRKEQKIKEKKGAQTCAKQWGRGDFQGHALGWFKETGPLTGTCKF